MKMIELTIHNNFHETDAKVLAKVHGDKVIVRERVIKRVEKALCGTAGCQCAPQWGWAMDGQGRRYNLIPDFVGGELYRFAWVSRSLNA